LRLQTRKTSWRDVRIEPATPEDLAEIQAAYEDARFKQQTLGAIVWPEFTEAQILAEIDTRHLFRVVAVDAISGVFSIATEDPAIWGAYERGAHLYLHRIARAARHPGRGLMDGILAWAEQRCAALRREGLRMDTWASNTNLIAYYQRYGFRVVDERRLVADPRLPAHYHGNVFALLERACEPRMPRAELLERS
jgi:ribosomal protein S18 acetylase RimI-like enzyme